MDSDMIHLVIGLVLGIFFSLCFFTFYYKFILCKHEYIVVKEVDLVTRAGSIPYGLTVIKQCKKCGNIKHKTINY